LSADNFQAHDQWVLTLAVGSLACGFPCGEGVERKLVGIRLTDKGVAREGAEIRNEGDEPVGILTSGGYSPSLKESIGMGYVQKDLAQTGQKLFVNVRGRNIAAIVSELPFVPAKTKSMKKAA